MQNYTFYPVTNHVAETKKKKQIHSRQASPLHDGDLPAIRESGYEWLPTEQ